MYESLKGEVERRISERAHQKQMDDLRRERENHQRQMDDQLRRERENHQRQMDDLRREKEKNNKRSMHKEDYLRLGGQILTLGLGGAVGRLFG